MYDFSSILSLFRFAIPYINVLFDHLEKYELESQTLETTARVGDMGSRGLIVASAIKAKEIMSKYYGRMHTNVFTTCTALEPRIKFMWHQQNRTILFIAFLLVVDWSEEEIAEATKKVQAVVDVHKQRYHPVGNVAESVTAQPNPKVCSN